MIDVINILSVVLTIIGALILSIKGDKIHGWIIYVFAAITGLIYFLLIINTFQIVLWIFFLVNNFIAVIRHVKTINNRKISPIHEIRCKGCNHLIRCVVKYDGLRIPKFCPISGKEVEFL